MHGISSLNADGTIHTDANATTITQQSAHCSGSKIFHACLTAFRVVELSNMIGSETVHSVTALINNALVSGSPMLLNTWDKEQHEITMSHKRSK